MIQNLQPLTPMPFYWMLGSSTVNPAIVSSKNSAVSKPHRTGVNLSRGSGWLLFNVGLEPQSSVPPSFSSCVKCLAHWCSLNLSGHYSPPSESTSNPSSLFSLFALCHPTLYLAPSTHNSANSADYKFPLCLMAQLLHHTFKQLAVSDKHVFLFQTLTGTQKLQFVGFRWSFVQ